MLRAVPALPAEILAHQTRLSGLVSALRPPRNRTPLLQLQAHRLPTLWSLYRSLLRSAPTENVRWRVRAVFRKHQHQQQIPKVQQVLERMHKLADVCRLAQQGDSHSQAVLQRYSTMIAAKRDKVRIARMFRDEMAWQERLRNRPIMTGSYYRPSLAHGPLPRLHPMPDHITCMVARRRRVRERRQARYEELFRMREYVQAETAFDAALQSHHTPELKKEYWSERESLNDAWLSIIEEERASIRQTYERDHARQSAPYPPEMLEAIKAARREKWENKNREVERERRGELTRRALRRQRQGPPAHILTTMTPKQRHMDRVSRSISEVGYVAKIKRKLGFKLKDPDAWKVELGKPENRKRLDQIWHRISAENKQRRKVTTPAS